MRYLALLHCFNFLVLKSFCRKGCKQSYDDNTPLDYFKDLYEANFFEMESSTTEPALDKKVSSIRDYFQESSCGDMAVEPEAAIVNGTDAPDMAWPWQTLIRTDSYMCGGVLISDRWVLSAAHCFYPPTKKKFYVELGMRVKGPERGDSVFTRGTKVIVWHEEYLDSEYTYDIALVKLDYRISFSQWVRPACLPLRRSVFNESNVCYITGFGEGAPEVDDHITLQQLRVHVVPVKECFYLWNSVNDAQIDKRSICVEARKRAGTCSGDSGGPLSCKDGSKYYVAGVTNFALATCMSDVIPAVYARVSEYLDWIFDVINKHKL